jgi:hypothetical protein
VQDLDVVEGDAFRKDPAEHFADLVLLADGAEEARVPSRRAPFLRRIRRERFEPFSGERFEKPPLDTAELTRCDDEEPRVGPRRAAGRERLGGAS